MAANFSDALSAFALGPLDKAGGTNFQAGMVGQARDKDMFLFQQKEAMRLRDEAKRKDREEQQTSRRNLIKALQSAGAVRPEDVVAAGGPDALAAMDDTEFAIVQQTLQRNRLKDASDEEQRAAAIAAARVRGIAVPDSVGRNEVIDLMAQVDYHDLLKEQNKQQRDETTRAMRTTVVQAQRDVAMMFERSQAVTADTMRNAWGRLQQAGARLAAGGSELSDADYENLQGELNSLADTIRRQQVNVDLNNLAREAPGRIIAGMAQLDPDQRSQALERPSISRAWSSVERAATQLASLGEEGAGQLGLGDLYKQASGNDPAQDGLLAQALFAAADKIAAGQGTLDAMGEAKKVSSALDTALEGFSNPVEVTPFIKNGQLDATGFAAEKLRVFKEGIPSMSRQELLKAQRRLQHTGLPASLIAGISADVDNQLATFVDKESPSSYLAGLVDQEQIHAADIKAAAMIPPIVKTTATANVQVFPGVPVASVGVGSSVNPEWAEAMARAFKDRDEALNLQIYDLDRKQALMNANSADFSVDSDERRRMTEFSRSLEETKDKTTMRKSVRDLINIQLSHLPLKSKGEMGAALFKLGGGKDVDTESRAAVEGKLTSGGLVDFFKELENSLRATVTNEDARMALSAEITSMLDMATNIGKMFEGENAEEVKRTLKNAGIITTIEDDSYPELEVLAYFMANQ